MEDTIDVNGMLGKMEQDMQASIERLKRDLSTLRTGRANPQLLDNVRVDYYGTPTPLKQVGAISVPDPRTLEIVPWDPSVLAEVEKAIMKADFGAMPHNDGKCIRLTLPAMTEDRRKTLVKSIKGMSEEFKVKIRNDRRDAVEKVKKALKVKEISEDDAKRHEQTIQKMTDGYVKKVDDISGEKEKEVMTI